MEHIRKRKAGLGKTVEVSAKKPKGFNSRSKGQHGRSLCGKCGRSHGGVYRAGCSSYYKCGKTEHFSKDCMAPIPTIQTSNLI